LPIYIFYQNFQCKNIKETPKKYQEIKKNVLEFFCKKKMRRRCQKQSPGVYIARKSRNNETLQGTKVQAHTLTDLDHRERPQPLD
jgi:hypothetical protein